jgi:RNA polymerase sigma-70 factor, ECF subfamily
VSGDCRPIDAEESTSPPPDVVLGEAKLTRRIIHAIDALPDRAREVFILKRDARLSYREIAALVDISPKTVEMHMGRALRLLRENLADLRT